MNGASPSTAAGSSLSPCGADWPAPAPYLTGVLLLSQAVLRRRARHAAAGRPGRAHPAGARARQPAAGRARAGAAAAPARGLQARRRRAMQRTGESTAQAPRAPTRTPSRARMCRMCSSVKCRAPRAGRAGGGLSGPGGRLHGGRRIVQRPGCRALTAAKQNKHTQTAVRAAHRVEKKVCTLQFNRSACESKVLHVRVKGHTSLVYMCYGH